MKIAFPGRAFASFWTIALIVSNRCVCDSLRVIGSPIQTTNAPARLTVSITPATRRRYSAVHAGLAEVRSRRPSGALSCSCGRRCHRSRARPPWAAATSTSAERCANQLNTSGRSSPVATWPSDASDRRDRRARPGRANDRTARGDHERITCDPESQLLLGGERGLRGGLRRGAGRGPARSASSRRSRRDGGRGYDDRDVDSILVAPADGVLRGACAAGRGAARG